MAAVLSFYFFYFIIIIRNKSTATMAIGVLDAHCNLQSNTIYYILQILIESIYNYRLVTKWDDTTYGIRK